MTMENECLYSWHTEGQQEDASLLINEKMFSLGKVPRRLGVAIKYLNICQACSYPCQKKKKGLLFKSRPTLDAERKNRTSQLKTPRSIADDLHLVGLICRCLGLKYGNKAAHNGYLGEIVS